MSDLKFFFCCSIRPLQHCCCGCSLRLGVQIITVLSIIGILGNMIMYNTYEYKLQIYTTVSAILNIISNLSLMISTYNNSIKLAKFGFFLNQALFIISIIFYIITGIIIFDEELYINGEYIRFTAGFMVVYYFFGFMIACLVFYYLQVEYSFVRCLDEEAYDVLDGRQAYLNTNNTNSGNRYYPPQQGQYPPQYPPQQGPYAPQYPPQQGQYPPHYPPQQGPYAPLYPPQPGQYNPQYPPEQGPYAPQYPPYYPPNHNQNIINPSSPEFNTSQASNVPHHANFQDINQV